ncbi:MAG: hypothetical protein AAF800_06115 [Planctomycetota bacterium]
MSIEFREIRREELDEALRFVAGLDDTFEPTGVDPALSLLARNDERVTLGSALHQTTPDGRRRLRVHLDPQTHPGLARLLIDRALRKAEAAGVSTAEVQIAETDTASRTWADADWLSRLRPAAPPAGPLADPVDRSADAA